MRRYTIRGGSWCNSGGYERSDFLAPYSPDVRNSSFGFRLVASVPDQAGCVLHGGAWLSIGGNVRSDFRARSTPGLRDDDVGFRLAGRISR